MDDHYNREYLGELAHKYKAGTITEEEIAYFETWYNSYNDEQLELTGPVKLDPVIIRERIHGKLKQRIAEARKAQRASKARIRLMWQRISSAAAILLIVGFFIYDYYRNAHLAGPGNVGHVAVNAAPGSNKAILILSDGRQVNLQDASPGELAEQSGVRISNTKDGQVIYSADGNSDGISGTHIIRIPRGGQYRLRLPDNTEVWLNAASTLKYPVSFNGRDKRLVELSGEAYFRVAKDKAHPFIVRTKDQEVKVLGTQFNVNSYTDEGKTVTTLEEGSVQVTAGAKQRMLRPGQQSILSGNKNITIHQADMNAALAWTSNEMVFTDAKVPEIMRQIGRWYDLDIEYRGRIPDDTINGTVDRRENLAVVLKMFATMQIHFSLEQTPTGKKLIIKP